MFLDFLPAAVFPENLKAVHGSIGHQHETTKQPAERTEPCVLRTVRYFSAIFSSPGEAAPPLLLTVPQSCGSHPPGMRPGFLLLPCLRTDAGKTGVLLPHILLLIYRSCSVYGSAGNYAWQQRLCHIYVYQKDRCWRSAGKTPCFFKLRPDPGSSGFSRNQELDMAVCQERQIVFGKESCIHEQHGFLHARTPSCLLALTTETTSGIFSGYFA